MKVNKVIGERLIHLCMGGETWYPQHYKRVRPRRLLTVFSNRILYATRSKKPTKTRGCSPEEFLVWIQEWDW